MSKEFDELQRRAVAKKEGVKQRMKRGYAYARSKGFSPYEAVILQGASLERIDRLAKELPQT